MAAASARRSPTPCRSPDLIALEGLPTATPWAAALHERWPGGAPLHLAPLPRARLPVRHAARAVLRRLARRQERELPPAQMRRLRRQFAAAGGTTRVTTAATLKRDVAAFMRLHTERWEGRGSSNLVKLGERLPALLRTSARPAALGALPPAHARARRRADLRAAVPRRRPHGALPQRRLGQAPREAEAVDARAARHRRGDVRAGRGRIDLGPGEQAYKQRFADGNAPRSAGAS